MKRIFSFSVTMQRISLFGKIITDHTLGITYGYNKERVEATATLAALKRLPKYKLKSILVKEVRLGFYHGCWIYAR